MMALARRATRRGGRLQAHGGRAMLPSVRANCSTNQIAKWSDDSEGSVQGAQWSLAKQAQAIEWIRYGVT
jgi:hypothetical protein